ncbi:RtcB family protein [Aliifodinibius salicampi]|uniref:3'-phosphate/5'-hydroxy nucleic acid ligase n=1 Tax=Fodinibius salicampi TaxID=1920655 RepID=A0ABT3PWH8_9BACT|nr:RtcB family protein [Fodinibius salicampi]MCW9712156.1 RtcB family protein [Fodinibius salicampi]
MGHFEFIEHTADKGFRVEGTYLRELFDTSVHGLAKLLREACTSSYVLTGTSKGMESTFGSTCHGAGRTMSRTAAKKSRCRRTYKFGSIKMRYTYRQLPRAGWPKPPLAYKEVLTVVNTVEQAGLAEKAVKMRPVAVIKG